jgi:uncharacterized membrane protein YphA (DoxX/SURF4 family)
LILIDKKLDYLMILYLFLGLFWLLNGLDKFFNGNNVINFNGYAMKAAIVDMNGTVAYTYQPTNPDGWFGVNRDAKTIGYFERLGLPAQMAIASLYSVAVVEVLLGIAFLSILFYKPLLPKEFEDALKRNQAFATQTIHRLAFKVSSLLFVAFMAMDTLFGDRTELWEHGTFLIMTAITYRFYLDHDAIEELEEAQIKRGLGNESESNPSA